MLKEISRIDQEYINKKYSEVIMSSKESIDIKLKVLDIKRLQEEARTLQAKSYRLLEDADILAKEVRNIGGERFVCDGIAYCFQHTGYEYKAGSRDWLVLDIYVRVI